MQKNIAKKLEERRFRRKFEWMEEGDSQTNKQQQQQQKKGEKEEG